MPQLPDDPIARSNLQPQPSDRVEDRAGRMGIIVATLGMTLCLSAWVAKGVIKREVPSTFEILFACGCACLVLVDPKQAANVSAKSIAHVVGMQPSSEPSPDSVDQNQSG